MQMYGYCICSVSCIFKINWRATACKTYMYMYHIVVHDGVCDGALHGARCTAFVARLMASNMTKNDCTVTRPDVTQVLNSLSTQSISEASLRKERSSKF